MCVCIYKARDKGISAQGVICVPLKFIMCSDSLRSVEEEEEHTDSSSVALNSCKVCSAAALPEVRDD